MLRRRGARLAMHSAGVRTGRRWKQRIALGLLVVCLVLVGCGESAARIIPVIGNGAAQAAVPLVPAAVATPDLAALRNASLGCARGAPRPTVDVVYTGLRPGTSGEAPHEVALTFDDGPTPSTSPPILSLLEKTHTPATFFVEGQYVHEWPNLLAREWNDGFAIGVHTWDHPLMSRLAPASLQHQFADTLQAIHSAIAPDACIWLWRPPFADYNRAVLAMAEQYGLTTVTWDDSSDDWTRPGAQQIAQNVLSRAHPGAIVLMHDGPALREQTAAALPLILAGLAQRGLTPVTLPKLLADGHYPGVSVSAPTGG